jgi:hypothetical protein
LGSVSPCGASCVKRSARTTTRERVTSHLPPLHLQIALVQGDVTATLSK